MVSKNLLSCISSQYNVEFQKSDFNKLKKVYSVWICTHSPLESDLRTARIDRETYEKYTNESDDSENL